jgi:hypothetical protein
MPRKKGGEFMKHSKRHTAYGYMRDARYTGTTVVWTALLLAFSLISINIPTIIDAYTMRGRIEYLLSKMVEVFDMSSSSGGISVIMGLTYSAMTDRKGVNFLTKEESRINEIFRESMEKYIYKSRVISTSPSLRPNASLHMCEMGWLGFLAEDKKLIKKKFMEECYATVPSRDGFSSIQTANYLVNKYNELNRLGFGTQVLLSSGNQKGIDEYIISDEFHRNDESMIYFANGMKIMLNQIVLDLSFEIDVWNKRVNWQIILIFNSLTVKICVSFCVVLKTNFRCIYVFAIILLGVLCIYKFIWFPYRLHSWHNIRSCILNECYFALFFLKNLDSAFLYSA